MWGIGEAVRHGQLLQRHRLQHEPAFAPAPRHIKTESSWRAIWPLLAPSATARTMRAERQLLRGGMAARERCQFLARAVRKFDDWEVGTTH